MMLEVTNLIFMISIGCIGATAGVTGVFVLLRNQSLLGDTLSHAALPGIVLMLLITHTKEIALLLFGGIISAACGALFVHIIHHKTNLKQETAMGIILSFFFGFGLLLLTILQKQPVAHQSILNTLFLGKAFLFLMHDSYVIIGCCIVIVLCIILFWKEYKLISFDPIFAKTVGYSSKWSFFLLCITIIIICLCLHTMGVILTSSLLIAPAAAARQWCKHIEQMAILAASIGAISGMVGILLSSHISHLPPGPAIVIILSICVAISIMASPKRIQSNELDTY